jgi:signal transduction histidine kinase
MSKHHNAPLSELTEQRTFAKPQLLRTYALLMGVALLLATLLGQIAVRHATVTLIGVALGCVALIGLVLTHRDHLNAARALLVIGVFVILSIALSLSKGSLGLEAAAHVIWLAMVGLLYRPRIFKFATLCSTLSVIVAGIIRTPAWLAADTFQANLTAVLGYVLLYVVTAVLILSMKSVLDATWHELNDNRAQLATNNVSLAEQVRERERAERIAREQSIELGALFDLSTALSSTLELSQLLGSIGAYLGQSIGFETVAIVEPGPNGMRALYHSGALTYSNTALSGSWQLDLTLDSDLKKAQQQRVPVIIEDVQNGSDSLSVEKRARAAGQGIAPERVASHIVAPLLTRNRVSGYLLLNATSANAYQQSDTRLIAAFASIIAASIEKSRLVDQSMQNATLAERSRIARELHDSVSQMLFGMRTALHNSDQVQPQTREALNYVYQLAESALTDTRAIVFELRPEYLEKEGLVSALKKQAETLCLRHHLHISTRMPDSEPELALKHKEALYRIVLEAIQNTIKHAGATHMQLEMTLTAQLLSISIIDNGRGFDANAAFDGHFGLKTMRERADQLNAEFTINSVPGETTTVRIDVPLQTTDAAADQAYVLSGLMR